MDGLVQGNGAHFVTGPVCVRGARPGDTLQVDILKTTLAMDWGFVPNLPLLGTLPDEFADYEVICPTIDCARNMCRLPWGTDRRSFAVCEIQHGA